MGVDQPGGTSEERGPHVTKETLEGANPGNPHRPPPRATAACGQCCRVIRLFQRKPTIKIFKGTCSTAKRESVCAKENMSTGGIPSRFPSAMVSGLTLWAPERRLLCPHPGQTLAASWTEQIYIPTLNG